mmetsp:Transcript_20773/g.42524  ORF Transcript_20773/g.42524 Transcript_20773/m.42524 type:complete len:266 (-) Transcript_20773:23-820(-)
MPSNSSKSGRKKKKGGGSSGCGGSGGSAREAEGQATAPQWDAGELPTPKATDRLDHLRPATVHLEIELAKKIAVKHEAELREEGAPTQKTMVPTIDLPNVMDQMRKERELFRQRQGFGSYQELARYGLFLKAVQERLAAEHKKSTQRQRLAKAMADRARGEREWSQRSEALERANRAVAKIGASADELNIHVRQLHATPTWVRAMAELRARDMVKPAWEKSFAPAPRTAEDLDAGVADDMTFEALLALEKERGPVLAVDQKHPSS